MFAVTRFRVPAEEAAGFARDAAALLAALAARPGFRDGYLGEAAEESGLWALVTSWEGVGAYRRGLGGAEVKIAGAPVWLHAVDEPGAFLPVS